MPLAGSPGTVRGLGCGVPGRGRFETGPYRTHGKSGRQGAPRLLGAAGSRLKTLGWRRGIGVGGLGAGRVVRHGPPGTAGRLTTNGQGPGCGVPGRGRFETGPYRTHGKSGRQGAPRLLGAAGSRLRTPGWRRRIGLGSLGAWGCGSTRPSERLRVGSPRTVSSPARCQPITCGREGRPVG